MNDGKRHARPPKDAQRSSASDALWSGVGFPGDVTVGGIGTRVLIVRRTASEAGRRVRRGPESEPARDDRAGEGDDGERDADQGAGTSGGSRRSVGR